MSRDFFTHSFAGMTEGWGRNALYRDAPMRAGSPRSQDIPGISSHARRQESGSSMPNSPRPLSVIPAKAGIQNFPSEPGLASVWHGASGFPPSRERRRSGDGMPCIETRRCGLEARAPRIFPGFLHTLEGGYLDHAMRRRACRIEIPAFAGMTEV